MRPIGYIGITSRGVMFRLGIAAIGLMMAITGVIAGTAVAAPRTLCGTVQCVIQVGDAAIANRITALNTLSTKITARQTRLTSAQVSALQSDVTTNLNGLQALKSKLDAETDMTAARADVKSIYVTFRIYAVVLPRDYHLIWLDIAANTEAKLKDAQPKIEAAIDAVSSLPDKDGDKGKLAAAFADYKNQVAAAEGQIDGAQGLVSTLTPSAFDSSPATYKTDFTDFRNDIKTAHTDIVAAAKDLHVIAAALRDLVGDQAGSNDTDASPTATVSQ